MNGSSDSFPSNGPPRADGPSWKQLLLPGVCRYGLAAVFLMAAVTKITAPDLFTEQVRHEAHLPSPLATAVVFLLPWLELICGTCLALGYAVREAALLTSFLLVLFLVHTLVNPGEADCGCFLVPLPRTATAAWWPPVRNVMLLACAVPLIYRFAPASPPRNDKANAKSN